MTSIFHSFLPMLRGFAESRMEDTWQVFRLEDGDTDPLTGLPGPEDRILVYSGPGRLQSFEGYERNPEVIGHSVTVQRMSLHLPIGDYRPQVGHVAVCTASRLDPNLVGTEYRMVQDAPFKTAGTAYRVFVDFEAG